MYAIIETGGKQYRVQPGDVIDVELQPIGGDRGPGDRGPGDRGPGDQGQEVSFDRVLMVSGDDGSQVGSPVLADARVRGVVLDEVRGPRIRVFKMKRRKGYRRTQGHRQNYLRVRIQDISV